MKTNSKSLIGGVWLSCALLIPTSGANAQSSATLVIPGKSLGRIALGMTSAQVVKVLGKSTKRVRLSSTLSSALWLAPVDPAFPQYRDVNFEVIYKKDRVVQIETTLPKFRTKSGLHAGSLLGTVERLVRPLIHSMRDAPENLVGHEFDGLKMGLAFETTGPNSGVLYREDTTNSLIVHRPGVPMVSNRGTNWISSSSVIVFHGEEAGE